MDGELRHGKISMHVNCCQKEKKTTTVCIGVLNVDLTDLSCCPEYWTRFPCYRQRAGFLSPLERVLYFLQIIKYQRTGFKKQDYYSGI